MTADEHTVLRVRERFRGNDGARVFDTYSDAALDPVVAFALLLLEARPHRMALGRGGSTPP